MKLPVIHDQKAAAERLGISERTLEKWRLENKGPDYIRIGKRRFYSEDALAAYINANTVQAGA